MAWVVPRPEKAPVLRVGRLLPLALERLFSPYGLGLRVASSDAIEGSFWGEEEAGLVGNELIVRSDTPVHSALHEGCHFICMTDQRRAALHTDAGGDDAEECAVCYLQLVLGATLPGVTFERLCADMDAWGYSFRLGSTERWFREDAEDALDWLVAHGVLLDNGQPTGTLRS